MEEDDDDNDDIYIYIYSATDDTVNNYKCCQ